MDNFKPRVRINVPIRILESHVVKFSIRDNYPVWLTKTSRKKCHIYLKD